MSKGTNKKKRIPAGNIWMTAPILDIVKKLTINGFVITDGRGKYVAMSYTKFLVLPVRDIVLRYRSIYYGFINYYSFSDNIYLFNKIHWILWSGLTKTLSRKLKVSGRALIRKFGKGIRITSQKDGRSKITDFAFETLKRRPMHFLINKVSDFRDPLAGRIWEIRTVSSLDRQCVSCGASENIEMHHVRHIRTINVKLNPFDAQLARINRKQVPLCRKCHNKVHRGEYKGMSIKKHDRTYKRV